MKIFITGASGFIGKSLLPVLKEHSLMCLHHSQPILSKSRNIKIIKGDLNEPESYIDQLKQFRPDCCLHLAWNGLPNYSVGNSTENLIASIGLLQNLVQVHCKKIFVIGSCWEYGTLTGAVTENAKIRNFGVFAAFKIALQTIGASICKEADIKMVWGRAFFVYGPGQRLDALIPTCFRNLKNGEELGVKNPLVCNDFVHVVDVANSIKTLIEATDSSGVYNIGSGVSSAVWEVVNTVAKEMGKPPPYTDMPINPNGNFADLGKISKHNWYPEITVAQGISNTVKFLKND